MWKFSVVLVLAAASMAAAPPVQDPSAFEQPGAGSMFDHSDPEPAMDSNSLRDKVDEAEPLYDALARETRRLDKPTKDALIQALAADYGLNGQIGPARRLLELSETVLNLEDAIRIQEDLVKRLGPDDPQGDAQAKKLQDLELGLSATRDDLRRQMTLQQKDINEKDGQQLSDWLMISEGQLRHQREAAAAAAAAHPAPEAAPLDAAGVTPPASARLSPVAEVVSPAAEVKP
jgi:hypothetical protein